MRAFKQLGWILAVLLSLPFLRAIDASEGEAFFVGAVIVIIWLAIFKED